MGSATRAPKARARLETSAPNGTHRSSSSVRPCTMAEWKPVIKSVDMKEECKTFAEKLVTDALAQFSVEMEIAAFLKDELDKAYGPSWHCTVGRRFGTYVTHETKNYIFMSVGNLYILLYKCAKSEAMAAATQ